ncbi:MAG: hypothetical protein P1U46_01075 [Patescibacteria group bacterium]|nr:hypothetical protein [Patescibacteria group bacterium]
MSDYLFIYKILFFPFSILIFIFKLFIDKSGDSSDQENKKTDDKTDDKKEENPFKEKLSLN